MAELNLFEAFDRFERGVQRLQLTRTLNNANQAVQQIHESEMDEAEQRQAIREVAQNFTTQLTSLGASPQQIAQTQQTLTPEVGREDRIREASGIAQAKVGAKLQGRMAEMQMNQAALGAALQGNPQALNMLDKDTRGRIVPGVGLALTAQDATRVKKLQGEIKPALQSLKRLKEISQMGATRRLSPELRKEAQALVGALRGQLRVPLIGPGAVSDQEREVLNEIIANPTDLLSFSATTGQSLDTLIRVSERRLAQEYQSAGIQGMGEAAPVTTTPGFRWNK